jgi:hypothetical protein
LAPEIATITLSYVGNAADAAVRLCVYIEVDGFFQLLGLVVFASLLYRGVAAVAILRRRVRERFDT